MVSGVHVSANTCPVCIRTKQIPQENFPACIGFVPGGYNTAIQAWKKGAGALPAPKRSRTNPSFKDLWTSLAPTTQNANPKP